MGAFKELVTETEFQDQDSSLERLDFEMEILDEALEVFDRRCQEIESALSTLLFPYFEAQHGFMKSQFILKNVE
ncbi:hypothetical protein AZI86_15930 [Bdellovibrio bacteriovorus]|uniref:Uncharacterized protein n=2 Tax=Bdellovibrio bacteriovorus TaxID=959 RepID=A0A150WHK3_BDEBC|nr:hypothetical protein AZI86_15930 [Bdellovibrio bacteriovorus]